MTWTKLHDACEHLDSKCILERCKTNSNEPLEVDDHGSTPLHILAWGNPKIELLEAMISCCPASLTDKDLHGDTSLHVACSYPETDVKVVKVMVDACPTLPSMTNKEGLMPLHVACRFAPHNEALIGFLIQAYPYALRSSIKMGNPAPPRKKRVGTSNGKEPDHFVTPNEGTNFSEIRFQNLSKQVRDGAYPLHMAAKAGAPKHVLEVLIKAADDVLLMQNKFGETPLHIALTREKCSTTPESDEIVELLIQQCRNALHIKDKAHKNLPLHIAAINGCSARVAKALLCEYMHSIHETNDNGKTALDLALESGKCDEDVLRLLEISHDVPDEKKED